MAYQLAHVSSKGQLAVMGSAAGAADGGPEAAALRQPLLAARRGLHAGLGAAGASVPPAPPSPFEQSVTPHLSLGPFMDTAPMAVRLDTPATRVHALFVGLSLRCATSPCVGGVLWCVCVCVFAHVFARGGGGGGEGWVAAGAWLHVAGLGGGALLWQPGRAGWAAPSLGSPASLP